MKKWKHLMFWTWGIFQIFIQTTVTAIFFYFFKFQDPFIIPRKKNLPMIGFMVHKTFGLNPALQRKNRAWKICTESWNIGKNISTFSFLSKISYLFADISGPDAYFSNLIFALKPWVQAGRFSTMNPIIGRIFFGLIKGSWNLKK